MATDRYYKAANNGHLEAHVKLAQNTGLGNGVPRSEVGSVEWYKRAADKGFSQAEYMYGLARLEGYGSDKDTEEAIKWIALAANHNFLLAQYRLGREYEKGVAVEQNYTQAFHWYNIAFSAGSANAAVSLGNLYVDGNGTERDIDKGLELLTYGAKKGHLYAQGLLGNLYLGFQDGINANPEKAVYWLKKASERNHPDALLMLARMHDIGEHLPLDEDKAYEYYVRASFAGSAEAQKETAVKLMSGDGIESRPGLALLWYYILEKMVTNLLSISLMTWKVEYRKKK